MTDANPCAALRAAPERRPERQPGLKSYDSGMRNEFRPRRSQTAEAEPRIGIPQARETAQPFLPQLFPRWQRKQVVENGLVEAFCPRSLYDANLVVMFLDVISFRSAQAVQRRAGSAPAESPKAASGHWFPCAWGCAGTRRDRLELGRDLISRGLRRYAWPSPTTLPVAQTMNGAVPVTGARPALLDRRGHLVGRVE